LKDRIAAEKKQGVGESVGEAMGIPSQVRSEIGKIVEGLAMTPSLGTVTKVTAPEKAAAAAKAVTEAEKAAAAKAFTTPPSKLPQLEAPLAVPRLEAPRVAAPPPEVIIPPAPPKTGIAQVAPPAPVKADQGIAAIKTPEQIAAEQRAYALAEEANARRAERLGQTQPKPVTEPVPSAVPSTVPQTAKALANAERIALEEKLLQRIQNSPNLQNAAKTAVSATNAAKSAIPINAGIDALIPDTTEKGIDTTSQQMDEQMGNVPVNAGIAKLLPSVEDSAKSLTDTGPKKGNNFDFNDFLIRMGLGMMAGKSPHALTNVGEAGIGALKSMDEQRKAASDRAYQESHMGLFGAQGEQARAYAAAIDRGAKEKNIELEIEKLVAAEIGKNKMLSLDPAARIAEENRLRKNLYESQGLTYTGGAGAGSTSGFKFLGVK
jgi:hypothetical protein